ncbi:MAG TPA: gas vesicle protein GvpG [Longimicrobiaceae bacterium]|nr:gas vesicle protein GvpG [Longimicrobiaceae bacterium]
MGLLKHLLFWPVTGPEFLVRFSLDRIQGVVREELTDDQSIKEELLALQMRLELGEIDDQEYVEQEAALMQRLREVREWRERLGMGTAGGPVRVARDEAEGTGEEAPEPASGGEPPRGGIASPDSARVEIDLGRDGG